MGKRAPVERRLRTVRRSGIWREFTERKWGWQARTAGAAVVPSGGVPDGTIAQMKVDEAR